MDGGDMGPKLVVDSLVDIGSFQSFDVIHDYFPPWTGVMKPVLTLEANSPPFVPDPLQVYLCGGGTSDPGFNNPYSYYFSIFCD